MTELRVLLRLRGTLSPFFFAAISHYRLQVLSFPSLSTAIPVCSSARLPSPISPHRRLSARLPIAFDRSLPIAFDRSLPIAFDRSLPIAFDRSLARSYVESIRNIRVQSRRSHQRSTIRRAAYTT
jgi:hypothetical protein